MGIISIIIILLGFLWLGHETDWLRVNLASNPTEDKTIKVQKASVVPEEKKDEITESLVSENAYIAYKAEFKNIPTELILENKTLEPVSESIILPDEKAVEAAKLPEILEVPVIEEIHPEPVVGTITGSPPIIEEVYESIAPIAEEVKEISKPVIKNMNKTGGKKKRRNKLVRVNIIASNQESKEEVLVEAK